jgi:hypothetical protein
MCAAPELSYALKGKLYLSKSGWLLLSVPNAIGHGAFQALNEAGAELPLKDSTGQFNAHVSVIRPEELEQIGGPNKITERGKEFGYTLGAVRSCNPDGWDGVSRCWMIEIRSPELEKLRKSYGLSALPKDGEYKFHMTFAIRKTKVTQAGPVTKGSGSYTELIKHGSTLAQDLAVARRKTKPPVSEAQADAGNYPKGKVRMHGFTIAIETGKGQTRSGTDPDGSTWSVTMVHDYGDIKRTSGKDGDPVDVFIGPDPDTEMVFVVDQLDTDGEFDEHKVMMGFKTEADAREGYLANYEDGWDDHIGAIVSLTIPQFTWWLERGRAKKPVADTKTVKVASLIHDPLRYLETTKQAATPGVQISESELDGKGLFATRAFQEGDTILSGLMSKSQGDDGLAVYDQGEHSRYVNHSTTPNAELRNGDSIDLVAQKDIAPGAELLADYNKVTATLGPGFRFTYQGKPYNGESTSDNDWLSEATSGTNPVLDAIRGQSTDSSDGDTAAGGDGDDLGAHANSPSGPGSQGDNLEGHGQSHPNSTKVAALRTAAREKRCRALDRLVASRECELSTNTVRSVTGELTHKRASASRDADGESAGRGGNLSLLGPAFHRPDANGGGLSRGRCGNTGATEKDACAGPADTAADTAGDGSNCDGHPQNSHGGVLKQSAFGAQLDSLLAGGMAGSDQPSFYANAIQQTPMQWDRQRGVAQNLLGHLSAIRARGDRAIGEAHSFDRLQNAMDPNRSIRQLQSYLAGTRQPIVANPIDRFIQGE